MPDGLPGLRWQDRSLPASRQHPSPCWPTEGSQAEHNQTHRARAVHTHRPDFPHFSAYHNCTKISHDASVSAKPASFLPTPPYSAHCAGSPKCMREISAASSLTDTEK